MSTSSDLDRLDRALISALRARPRASVTELARTVGAARNTVGARLTRLEDEGTITGYGPDVDARAAGYPVLAFVTLMIAQGAHERTVAALAELPEVLEIHTITGRGDLLAKVVAATNDDLHGILQRIAAIPEVARTDTQLALHTSLARTIADLIATRDP